MKEQGQGERLDAYLHILEEEVSRNQWKQYIQEGQVLLNGKKEKPSVKLNVGDRIEVEIAKNVKECIQAENIPLEIVYEDEDILLVNKERGMVVHPASGNYTGTLVNALLYYLGQRHLSKLNGKERPGIVHRIDKDTSGLLLVAKNDTVHLDLAEQLKAHSINRQYTFICHGRLEEERIIEEPLGRNPKNRLKMGVVKEGKYAYTKVQPIEIFNRYTYARAILKTGRTHQIRVHLRYINRPIVGDRTYSNYKERIEGQLLHAGTLGFVHPGSKKYMEFRVEEPDIFLKELEKIRNNPS